MTNDVEAENVRINRGLVIRRPTKKVNIVNDARVKMCVARYDNDSYARLEFLSAVRRTQQRPSWAGGRNRIGRWSWSRRGTSGQSNAAVNSRLSRWASRQL